MKGLAQHVATAPPPVMIGATMCTLLQSVDRMAIGDEKVLITGETGVGKDLIARRLHAGSPRRDRAFVPVNCAAVIDTLMESELFGHQRGSFTGADRDRVGKIRLAHRGTLFLDEVGEMGLRMQAVLLRFLESGETQAVGSDTVGHADVRVVTATNRDLPAMIAAGTFRADLLYRLRVLQIHVPPLRERTEDLPALVQHFLDPGRAITAEALARLAHYAWPGNVRELEHVVRRGQWHARYAQGDAGRRR